MNIFRCEIGITIHIEEIEKKLRRKIGSGGPRISKEQLELVLSLLFRVSRRAHKVFAFLYLPAIIPYSTIEAAKRERERVRVKGGDI